MLSFLTTTFYGKVAKALVSIWLKDDHLLKSGADLTVEFFQSRIDNVLDSRKTDRLFAAVEDDFFASLAALIETEFKNHKKGDIKLVIDRCLYTVCNSDFYDLCFEKGFNSDVIFAEFQIKNRNQPKSLVVSDELFFGIAKFAIAKFLSILAAFPEFSVDALKAILTDTTEILEKIHNLENQFGRLEQIVLPDSVASETAYRSAYVQRLGKLNVLGLDTAGLPKKYDLSVAYINLTISGRISGESDNAAKVMSLAFRNPEQLTIVSGEPGSGKTTLLSWLSLCIVQRRLPRPLGMLAGFFPIFLRLREFAGREFPARHDLVLGQLGASASKIDPAWVEFVIKNRQLMFFVDGYDELPPDCRRRAQRWLDDVLATWPDCKVVLSTRSYAAHELSELLLNYGSAERELNVEPMNLDQVCLFILRWYKAYSEQLFFGIDDGLEDYEVLKNRLIRQIYSNSILRSIVRNPLVCSLICFVNTDRRGIVPSDRGELYRIATSALVARRDSERGIDVRPGSEYSEKQRMKILGYVAEYFYLRKSFQLPITDIVSRLEEYLPALGINPNHSNNIVEYLAERSHVLRSPSVGVVDFSHKTFQEYFYAVRIVENGMIEFVRDNFSDPDFTVVSSFVMSVSPPAFADKLVKQLLAQLNTLSVTDRRRCLILLQGAIRDVAELQPDLRREVQSLLSEVLPPKNMTEAEELSAVGEIIYDPLADFANVEHAAYWPFCVAALIGSMDDEAIYALGEYASLGDPKIDNQLCNGRDLFNGSLYRALVLSKCKSMVEYEIRSSDDVSVALSLPRVRRIIFSLSGEIVDISDPNSHDQITHVVVRRSARIKQYAFLKCFPMLKNLEIYSTVDDVDFQVIGACRNLVRLTIYSDSLENLSFIEKLSKLERLDLMESVNFSNVDPLRNLNSLKRVDLPYSRMYDDLSVTDFTESSDSYLTEYEEMDDELYGDVDDIDHEWQNLRKIIEDVADDDRVYFGQYE